MLAPARFAALAALSVLWVLVGEVRAQRPKQPVPEASGAGGYLDIRRDGSYRYAYATGDAGRHYHTASASPENTVVGRFGDRDPTTGRVRETSYTAGRNGFRARGPHIARKMSLSQTRIPYNPPVSPNSPNYKPTYSTYRDPNNDPSYEFGFRSPKHNRQETSDSRGSVTGSYSYVDDVGVRHDVAYEAGAKTGFHVKTPYPDSDNIGGALFYRKPNKGGVGFRGHTAIQRGKDGSFRFTATGPDQKHTETTDKNNNRRGTYTYLDPKGVQRTTEYIAGPNIGYKVINTKLSSQFSAAYPFLPPSFLIPPGGELDPESLNTAATSAGVKPPPPPEDYADIDGGDVTGGGNDGGGGGGDGGGGGGDGDGGGGDSAGEESSTGDFPGDENGGGDTDDSDGDKPYGQNNGNKPSTIFRPTVRPQRPSGGFGASQKPNNNFNTFNQKPNNNFNAFNQNQKPNNNFNAFNQNQKPNNNFNAFNPNQNPGDNFDYNQKPSSGSGFNQKPSSVFQPNGNRPSVPGVASSEADLGVSDFGVGDFGNKRPASPRPSITSPGGGGVDGDGFPINVPSSQYGGDGDAGFPSDNFSPSTTVKPSNFAVFPPDIFGLSGSQERPRPSAEYEDNAPTSRPPSRPSGGRPPTPAPFYPPPRPRPSRPSASIDPPYPASFRPDGDDAVFGPTSPKPSRRPPVTPPRKPNPTPPSRPGSKDDYDDVFGPPQTSGIDFTRPIVNEDLTGDVGGYNPNGGLLGPDSQQLGSDRRESNCCGGGGGRRPSGGAFAYDQSTAQNAFSERFFSFPPGVSIKAHVQSLDIVPYGSRTRTDDEDDDRRRARGAAVDETKEGSEQRPVRVAVDDEAKEGSEQRPVRVAVDDETKEGSEQRRARGVAVDGAKEAARKADAEPRPEAAASEV